MSSAAESIHEIELHGELNTEALGQRIGEVAEAGLVVDLRGELGAGKTALVRGLAAGLGVEGMVRSPTFTIASLHQGAVPLLHVDAYRLEDSGELALHGWDDWLSDGVIAVEWAGRVEDILPQRRLGIELAHGGPDIRLARISATGLHRQDGVWRAFDQAILC